MVHETGTRFGQSGDILIRETASAASASGGDTGRIFALIPAPVSPSIKPMVRDSQG